MSNLYALFSNYNWLSRAVVAYLSRSELGKKSPFNMPNRFEIDRVKWKRVFELTTISDSPPFNVWPKANFINYFRNLEHNPQTPQLAVFASAEFALLGILAINKLLPTDTPTQ